MTDDFTLPARLPSALRPPRGWTLRRADGTEDALDVPERTEAQRARSKRNVDDPPPPENHKRHAQTEGTR